MTLVGSGSDVPITFVSFARLVESSTYHLPDACIVAYGAP
jgi:hypothetical protein